MSHTQSLPHLARAPKPPARPTRQEAEEAIRVLLAWAGEDPEREGLRDTPNRVVDAYAEYFKGYNEDAVAWLADPEIDMSGGYRDLIMLTGVRVQSFCEHHMTPFEGTANLAYLPSHHVVGLSRLARVVETLSRRLQTQESLTEQISQTMRDGLAPRGVAVLIEAEHHCMSFRGIRQSGVKTITTHFSGTFDDDATLRDRFMLLCHRQPRSPQ